MNPQNLDPLKDKTLDLNTSDLPDQHSGLDDWNDRLDENLEPEQGGDEEADENARDYTDSKGSGDQSDEHNAQK